MPPTNFNKTYVPPTFISKIIISAALKGSAAPILRPASRTECRKNARPAGRTKKKREKIYDPNIQHCYLSLALRKDRFLDVLSLMIEFPTYIFWQFEPLFCPFLTPSGSNFKKSILIVTAYVPKGIYSSNFMIVSRVRGFGWA